MGSLIMDFDLCYNIMMTGLIILAFGCGVAAPDTPIYNAVAAVTKPFGFVLATIGALLLVWVS